MNGLFLYSISYLFISGIKRTSVSLNFKWPWRLSDILKWIQLLSSQIQARSKGLFSWANSRCCTGHEVLHAARSLTEVFGGPRQNWRFWWQCWWEFGRCSGSTGNSLLWGAGRRRVHGNIRKTNTLFTTSGRGLARCAGYSDGWTWRAQRAAPPRPPSLPSFFLSFIKMNINICCLFTQIPH